MADEFFAIVVQIPQPEDNCFIAIPFTEEFNPISDSIEKAAGHLGLKPVRTDLIAKGTDFVDDIFSLIRSARLVVAVCTPELSSGRPNSNVMYELGLAHSIAKPALVVTTDLRTLPSDIRNINSLQYKQEKEKEVTGEIELEMNRILTHRALSDPAVPGITIARAKHRMLLRPDFWINFETALSFANRIERQSRTIRDEYLDQLVKRAEEIVFIRHGRDPCEDIQSLFDMLRLYIGHMQELVSPPALERLEAELREAGRAFGGLMALADGDAERARISSLQGTYEIIRNKLATYPAALHQTHEIRDALVHKQEERDTHLKTWDHLKELHDAARELINYSQTLINKMITMMTAGQK